MSSPVQGEDSGLIFRCLEGAGPKGTERLKELQEALERFVNPQTLPVGIKMVR